MAEAAFTEQAAGTYPAYVNARMEQADEQMVVVLRVRSQGSQDVSEIRMEISDFQQWAGDALRMTTGTPA